MTRTIAAAPAVARAPAIATLPLAGSVVDICAHGGTLQLCLRDAGWPDGAPGSAARPWINRFCTLATPAELRAIADAVEASLIRVAP